MQSEEQIYKFIVVLSKNLEPGVAMNATAHMCLGIIAKANVEHRSKMKFMHYQDAQGIVYPSISAWPVIILKGKDSHIQTFYQAVQEKGFLYTAFLETMTGGIYQEQMQNTKNTETKNIKLYGIAAFALKAEMDQITKKFSLWV